MVEERRVAGAGSSRALPILRRPLLLGLSCMALCCLHVPAHWKILGFGMGDEVPDNLSFRGSKLLDELLKLGLRGFVQPEHEPRAIDAGIMGTLFQPFLPPAGGKILNAHLAHHVTEPWGHFHSDSGSRLFHLLMQLSFDVQV